MIDQTQRSLEQEAVIQKSSSHGVHVGLNGKHLVQHVLNNLQIHTVNVGPSSLPVPPDLFEHIVTDGTFNMKDGPDEDSTIKKG
jgi:hypothetical protein